MRRRLEKQGRRGAFALFTWVLYTCCLLAAAFSWRKDKRKTKQALIKAWKAFENILPQFLGVLILVGILLSVLKPETISALLGRKSGWLGVGLGAVLGAVTLIPGFVAFPLAAMLMRGGAGAMQMGAFICTLRGLLAYSLRRVFTTSEVPSPA